MNDTTNQINPPVHDILLKGSDTWREVTVGHTAILVALFLRFDTNRDETGTITVELRDRSELTLPCDNVGGMFNFLPKDLIHIKALRTEDGMEGLFIGKPKGMITQLTNRNDIIPSIGDGQWND